MTTGMAFLVGFGVGAVVATGIVVLMYLYVTSPATDPEEGG